LRKASSPFDVRGTMDVSAENTTGIRVEIEFARALTAVILAVKLELAEERTQDAYNRIANIAPPIAANQ